MSAQILSLPSQNTLRSPPNALQMSFFSFKIHALPSNFQILGTMGASERDVSAILGLRYCSNLPNLQYPQRTQQAITVLRIPVLSISINLY